MMMKPFQSILRLNSLIQTKKRPNLVEYSRRFSSNQKLGFWEDRQPFYECTQYALPNIEKGFIERALLGGCRAVVTCSSENLNQVYELLSDLQDPELLGDTNLEVGHISIPKSNPTIQSLQENWKSDFKIIKQHLSPNQNLSFITVASPLPLLIESTQTFQTLMDSLKRLAVENGLPNCKLGIHLSTNFLLLNKIDDLERLAQLVVTFKEKNQQFSLVTVSTNILSLEKVQPIVKKLKGAGLTVVGTNTLAMHQSKPGQISTHYGYMPTHIRHERNEQFTVKENQIHHAIKDFNYALDRCLAVEQAVLKRDIDQLKENNIVLDDLLIANRLYPNISQIYYPEEWNFIYSNQIIPKLEKVHEDVLKISEHLNAWVRLHRPASLYLIHSLRDLLQCRTLMCSEELFSHFQKYEIYRDQNIDILPGILSRQYKELSGADAVGLSLTKINKTDPIHQIFEKGSPLWSEKIATLENHHKCQGILSQYRQNFFQVKRNPNSKEI